MILFLLVTAPLNIALGYGLAVYLERAKRRRDAEAMAPMHSEAFDAPYPVAGDPALAAVAAAAAATADVETPVTPAAPAEGTELEHDVLAGIEEFRNQLAQMKAQPANEPAAVAE